MIQRYHAYGTYAGDDGTFVDYNDHAAALAAKDAEIERLRDRLAVETLALALVETIARAERAEAEAEIGRKWHADSSLETWFPYTAEELTRLRAELVAARTDAERWRAVSAMMTHEHRGDAVGWTLSVLLPGDDPDAAIDAADVEGMVRLGAQMARDFHAESIDAIVQSVMEGGQ